MRNRHDDATRIPARGEADDLARGGTDDEFRHTVGDVSHSASMGVTDRQRGGRILARLVAWWDEFSRDFPWRSDSSLPL